MKRSLLLSLAVLGLALAVPSCMLTSGQFVVGYDDFDNPVVVTGLGALYGHTVDLNTVSDYNDHKENLKGLLDLALVGEITNNDGSDPVDIQLWMTPDPSNHLTASSLQGDATAVQVWGPFHLAAGQTRRLGWNESAKLFTAAGKQALISQVQGDGVFTVYLLGASGTYSFTIADPALILVLDAGL